MTAGNYAVVYATSIYADIFANKCSRGRESKNSDVYNKKGE